ncbi:hypothetical protein BREU_0464 [Bifidobacterium reuteri DSM 23975]|uniref:CTP synthase n=1 Tax=Bifidobacterium reuteri DSM 23975 TaxID=1437610 RepID=A0A087CYK3_9BIFI|nr:MULTISPECIES: hypothetical protein [Bifidobacterium]KFI88353.1 hypothetical protein BREU_0464 [Bifidobacterium reuteri DSM 23975]TPF93564.1 hypothetical protein BW14_04680 [Bifidobacterium sp. UTBIF-68]
MKHHKEVATLIAQAESEQRCAYGTTKAHRSALARRAQAQELERVFPNMYARPDYWASLHPDERTRHRARTLHLKHPDWVFAGITAAAIHGFDHQWHLHADSVTITATTQGNNASTTHVKRIFASDCTPVRIGELPVTSKARTVVDCGLSTEFRFALPVIDSALRKEATIADILNICSTMRRDCTPLFRLLHYANPASENGGESLGRGTIIEGGLAVPELQQEIIDPQTGDLYRVDYLWRLPTGRTVVGEFDGFAKYVDPDMNNRKGIRGAVHAEKERETGLYRAGVDTIVRFTYEDALAMNPLLNKLRAAGIPQATAAMGSG